MALYRLGDRGSAVAEIRSILAAQGLLTAHGTALDAPRGRHASPADRVVDGHQIDEAVFDQQTDHAVRAFQQERGLIVDGIVGPATYRVLREASYQFGARVLAFRLSAPMHGDDVATLQSRLQNLGYYTGLVDGRFGEVTHKALCQYQGEYGMVADGICGPGTLRSLERLGTRVTGGSPHAIREEETVRRSGPQLAGKRIVIDAGVGAIDGLVDARLAELETNILWDLARRLEGRMGAAGVETFAARSYEENPDDATRAARANSVGADLVIALRCGHHRTPKANGVATFHFGNSRGSVSSIGHSLSGFIQREIAARTPLLDCRSHGRTWDLLRLTEMPVVQVDVGFVTNPGDTAMLSDAGIRDTIADAILVAVKRLYLLGADDQPTGTYTFADLLASEQLAR
ncbi:N-acetylmuramoyl-L-alanine amidase [Williamsia sp. CHRR-6]|uniref:N-acetylmuramoyl-L-alanine amidase n=1 Tax=Williamsia sp. CHRR-6 TaxID=2835871 RepID=UPI001BDB5A73|nr:N-acetylmuramoyl-L-alanine amidase [Williamsia sp. CHRR-6]MBT0567748.1 peptidoglycan-binding protein [Williamsia sp. CHRR-6]